MAEHLPETFDGMKDSKYLKKEDVDKVGYVVTITGFRKENLAMEGEPAEYKWVMDLAELKPMVLGPVNIDLLKEALGINSPTDAIGHQIVVYEDPNVTMKGKRVGGVRIRGAEQIAVPQAPARPMPPPNRPAPAASTPVAPRRPAAAPPPRDPNALEDDIPF